MGVLVRIQWKQYKCLLFQGGPKLPSRRIVSFISLCDGIGGMMRALEKRPVETQQVERAIRDLLRKIRTLEEPEVPSSAIGEWVAAELARLDQVAYVRFASVYRRFEDVQAFREEIERLEKESPGGLDTRQISLLGRRD